MWYSIFDENWIRLTQGNSLEREFKMGSDAANATVLFTMNNKLGEKIIQKTQTADEHGDVTFHIEPSETKDLLTGEYLYDVLYQKGDTVKTFVACIFQILPAFGLYTDIEPGPIPPEPDLPENTYVTSDGMYYVTSDGYIYVTKGE